jgi:hypothetical protein
VSEVITTMLTPTEKVALTAYEKTISTGLAAFYEVGNALLVIREQRLYRASHDTFESYCRDRWGMSDRHGRRLIEAADIVTKMQVLTGPMGPVPTSERQARELVGLEPAVTVDVMAKAVESGSPVTAHSIREARQEVAPTSRLLALVPKPKTKTPLSDAMRDDVVRLKRTIAPLRRLRTDDRFTKFAPYFGRYLGDLDAAIVELTELRDAIEAARGES